jgi:plasmid stabilization system protein ParE
VAKPVELQPAALAEAEGATAWYAERDPRVAAAFVGDLEAALDFNRPF